MVKMLGYGNTFIFLLVPIFIWILVFDGSSRLFTSFIMFNAKVAACIVWYFVISGAPDTAM